MTANARNDSYSLFKMQAIANRYEVGDTACRIIWLLLNPEWPDGESASRLWIEQGAMKQQSKDSACGHERPSLRTRIYARGLSKASRDLQHQLIIEAAKTEAYRHLELVPPLYVETTRTNAVAERLLRDARDGQFDAVICYDLGRLGSGLEEAVNVCNRLLCTGVRIFTVTRGEVTSNTLFIARPPD